MGWLWGVRKTGNSKVFHLITRMMKMQLSEIGNALDGTGLSWKIRGLVLDVLI